MPRPSKFSNEKSKDFKGSIVRLFKELKRFHVGILIALIFAVASSVLSISAPNQLSKLTDEITSGLVVNQKNMKKITKKVTSNLQQEQIQSIMMSDALSVEEKQELMIQFQSLDMTDTKNTLHVFDQLSDHEKEVLFPEFKVDDTKISSQMV